MLYCFMFFVGLTFCVATTTMMRSSESSIAPTPGDDDALRWWIPKPFKKYFVRVINDLGASRVLQFHCMSKDDDLGLRTLPSIGEFEFKFRINFSGSTLFSCDFTYLNHHVTFDAFRADEDFLKTCSGVHCIWEARPDGIYLMDREHIYKKKYSWDQKTM